MLAEFPNDLARLVHLASIRDYNTGVYLHSELSRRFGVAAVDQILKLQHQEIFDRLLEAPISSYVDQLRLYISFTHASPAELIRTWKDLKAYSSAIPLGCDLLAAELFAWNVMSALYVLEGTEQSSPASQG